MERRKLILIGLPSVGKTSLVTKCVHGIFSEKYISTIGVKIDKKDLTIGGHDVLLQIWDLAGSGELDGAALAYIRGADACLLVADGTREQTIQVALELKWKIRKALGNIPFALAINKQDLEDSWHISPATLERLNSEDMPVFKTSAKSGAQVENAFLHLAKEAISEKRGKAAS